MPEKTVREMCNLAIAGQDAYEAFVCDWVINSTVNLWAPMKRMNFHTWKDASKSNAQKIGSQVIELKSEGNLFARCLIVAQSRPEIDARESLGKYEFSSYPRSLFDSSGVLLPTIDKSKLMSALEECAKDQKQPLSVPVTIKL